MDMLMLMCVVLMGISCWGAVHSLRNIILILTQRRRDGQGDMLRRRMPCLLRSE